jgi:small subunit ribosomal protein S8
MMTDPIADMLTRIRNALAAKHASVLIPASRVKTEIARILQEEGFVEEYSVTEHGAKQDIDVVLKYTDKRQPVISGVERVSTPGRRVYCSKDDIPVVLNGLGVAIISTSQGLASDQRCREIGIGGEVLCKVW